MTSDSSAPATLSTLPQSLSEADSTPQVRFKSEGGRLLLLLPPETETAYSVAWSDVCQQLRQQLDAGERFWQTNTPVHLIARDRLLDVRQLQAIADILTEAQLQLKRVYTSRRQTAVAAATVGYSVEQHTPVTHLNQPTGETGKPLAEPLYVQTTVRSGMEIRHPGTVIVMGDINPGGSVIADGDVLIWGTLRGLAQAGAAGNTQCVIMALRMEPTQIRIAHLVARPPENPPLQYHPETAYVTPNGIRITRAADFPKIRLMS